jgi:hypothetical protein
MNPADALTRGVLQRAIEAIGVSNQVTVLDPPALRAAGGIAPRELRALDAACSRFR